MTRAEGYIGQKGDEPQLCGGCHGTGKRQGLKAGMPPRNCDLCNGTGVIRPDQSEEGEE